MDGGEIIKWLGAGGVGLLMALLGFETYKRKKSQGTLSDAEDTVGIGYVGAIERRETDALKKLDAVLAINANLREEIAGMKIRGAARDVKDKVTRHHLLTLTRIVVEKNPADARWARESAFMDILDEDRKR